MADLPQMSFGTDRDGVGLKIGTDVELTDMIEKDLSDLGLIALCRARDTPYAKLFHGNASLQRPRAYDPGEESASANARLSAMLQYVFCISRFAHYVKIIGRDRVGAFQTAEAARNSCAAGCWQYSISSDLARTSEQRPLPAVREVGGCSRSANCRGRPGLYSCTIHLRPHFQLDQVASSFRLVTELNAPGAQAA